PGGAQTISQPVDLLPGSNRIEVMASNEETESLPASVTIDYDAPAREPAAPKVFGLAIGVSTFAAPRFKLKFAHLDAQAFADVWKKQEGRLYSSVEFKVLQNEKATKTSI